MAANAEAAKVESHKIIHIRQGGDLPSACRFWGSIPLNKVAGNFHIMPGKAIPHPMGHAHMNFFGAERFNFSHRIDHFSFGSPTSGLLYPLDGDVVIQSEENEQFNYIINVVPTHLKTFRSDKKKFCRIPMIPKCRSLLLFLQITTWFRFSMRTYQYAVTQHTKVIQPGTHSHVGPGIFFK